MGRVVPLALVLLSGLAPVARAQCPPLPLSQDRCYKPAYTSTQWTTVYPNEGKVFHVVEGVPQDVSGGGTDNCLSHVFYDINMDVKVDPQYLCLIADGTQVIHTEREFQTMPLWIWPNTGDPANPDDGVASAVPAKTATPATASISTQSTLGNLGFIPSGFRARPRRRSSSQSASAR